MKLSDHDWGLFCPSFVLGDFVGRAGSRQAVELQFDLIINGVVNKRLTYQVRIISFKPHEDNPVIASIKLFFEDLKIELSGICDLRKSEAIMSFFWYKPLLPPEWWGLGNDLLPPILRENNVVRLEDLNKFTALQICRWFIAAAPEGKDGIDFAASSFIQIYDWFMHMWWIEFLPGTDTINDSGGEPTKDRIAATLRGAQR